MFMAHCHLADTNVNDKWKKTSCNIVIAPDKLDLIFFYSDVDSYSVIVLM